MAGARMPVWWRRARLRLRSWLAGLNPGRRRLAWRGLAALGLICVAGAILARQWDDDSELAQALRGKRSLPPFDRDAARKLRNLVIVPTQGMLAHGHHRLQHPKRDESWMLSAEEQDMGMPEALVGHIREGVRRAAVDEEALLVFSGGQTRLEAGQRSEAASYLAVADHYAWWGAARMRQVRARLVLEEFATDSFENLLFAIGRFREVTGVYPARFTVVGFVHQDVRFDVLHRGALRIPENKFTFVGLDPDNALFQAKQDALLREEIRVGVKAFEFDPYGCAYPLTLQRRRERNPFARTAPYRHTCPELRRLITFCNPGRFPAGRLPWDEAALAF